MPKGACISARFNAPKANTALLPGYRSHKFSVDTMELKRGGLGGYFWWFANFDLAANAMPRVTIATLYPYFTP
jgi:hypothetical protein